MHFDALAFFRLGLYLSGDRARAITIARLALTQGLPTALKSSEALKTDSGATGLENIFFEDRALLLVVDLLECEYRQAGEIFNLNEDSVRARLHRIRKTLLQDTSMGLFENELALERRSKRIFNHLPMIELPEELVKLPSPGSRFQLGKFHREWVIAILVLASAVGLAMFGR